MREVEQPDVIAQKMGAVPPGWPRTQVHAQYDVGAAKERLRVDTRRPFPSYPPIYDPYKPRVLEHRQADVMPYWVEALAITVVFIAALAIFIVATLSSRG